MTFNKSIDHFCHNSSRTDAVDAYFFCQKSLKIIFSSRRNNLTKANPPICHIFMAKKLGANRLSEVFHAVDELYFQVKVQICENLS